MTTRQLTGLLLALAVVAVATLFSGVPAALAQDAAPVNICGRTPEVRAAILTATATVDTCTSVLPSDLNTVTNLVLSDMSLTTLTDGDFGGLERLDITRNQLTTPPVLTGLTELEYLDLSANQLTDAPDLTGLTDLGNLNLDNNKLTIAPDVSANANLQSLNLGRNQLTDAPDVSDNANLRPSSSTETS